MAITINFLIEFLYNKACSHLTLDASLSHHICPYTIHNVITLTLLFQLLFKYKLVGSVFFRHIISVQFPVIVFLVLNPSERMKSEFVVHHSVVFTYLVHLVWRTCQHINLFSFILAKNWCVF